MSLITRAFSLSSVRDLEIVHVLIRHSTKVPGPGIPGQPRLGNNDRTPIYRVHRFSDLILT